jgi:hypothetical protein
MYGVHTKFTTLACSMGNTFRHFSTVKEYFVDF